MTLPNKYYDLEDSANKMKDIERDATSPMIKNWAKQERKAIRNAQGKIKRNHKRNK